MAGDARVTTREYPYATLFRHLQHELHLTDVEVSPVALFGAGKAEAIALAARSGAVLLINEKPGMDYARNLGVAVASVPAVVVLLRLQGIISDRAARRKLGLIAANTAPPIIEDATHALDARLDAD